MVDIESLADKFVHDLLWEGVSWSHTDSFMFEHWGDASFVSENTLSEFHSAVKDRLNVLATQWDISLEQP